MTFWMITFFIAPLHGHPFFEWRGHYPTRARCEQAIERWVLLQDSIQGGPATEFDYTALCTRWESP